MVRSSNNTARKPLAKTYFSVEPPEKKKRGHPCRLLNEKSFSREKCKREYASR